MMRTMSNSISRSTMVSLPSLTGEPSYQGVLEKKGMGIFYKPWARRQFFYFREERTLAYQRDATFRGAVVICHDSTAREVPPKDAGGKNFAFEIYVYKHVGDGKFDKTKKRYDLINDVDK